MPAPKRGDEIILAGVGHYHWDGPVDVLIRHGARLETMGKKQGTARLTDGSMLTMRIFASKLRPAPEGYAQESRYFRAEDEEEAIAFARDALRQRMEADLRCSITNLLDGVGTQERVDRQREAVAAKPWETCEVVRWAWGERQ